MVVFQAVEASESFWGNLTVHSADEMEFNVFSDGVAIFFGGCNFNWTIFEECNFLLQFNAFNASKVFWIFDSVLDNAIFNNIDFDFQLPITPFAESEDRVFIYIHKTGMTNINWQKIAISLSGALSTNGMCAGIYFESVTSPDCEFNDFNITDTSTLEGPNAKAFAIEVSRFSNCRFTDLNFLWEGSISDRGSAGGLHGVYLLNSNFDSSILTNCDFFMDAAISLNEIGDATGISFYKVSCIQCILAMVNLRTSLQLTITLAGENQEFTYIDFDFVNLNESQLTNVSLIMMGSIDGVGYHSYVLGLVITDSNFYGSRISNLEIATKDNPSLTGNSNSTEIAWIFIEDSDFCNVVMDNSRISLDGSVRNTGSKATGMAIYFSSFINITMENVSWELNLNIRGADGVRGLLIQDSEFNYAKLDNFVILGEMELGWIGDVEDDAQEDNVIGLSRLDFSNSVVTNFAVKLTNLVASTTKGIEIEGIECFDCNWDSITLQMSPVSFVDAFTCVKFREVEFSGNLHALVIDLDQVSIPRGTSASTNSVSFEKIYVKDAAISDTDITITNFQATNYTFSAAMVSLRSSTFSSTVIENLTAFVNGTIDTSSTIGTAVFVLLNSTFQDSVLTGWSLTDEMETTGDYVISATMLLNDTDFDNVTFSDSIFRSSRNVITTGLVPGNFFTFLINATSLLNSVFDLEFVSEDQQCNLDGDFTVLLLGSIVASDSSLRMDLTVNNFVFENPNNSSGNGVFFLLDRVSMTNSEASLTLDVVEFASEHYFSELKGIFVSEATLTNAVWSYFNISLNLTGVTADELYGFLFTNSDIDVTLFDWNVELYGSTHINTTTATGCSLILSLVLNCLCLILMLLLIYSWEITQLFCYSLLLQNLTLYLYLI